MVHKASSRILICLVDRTMILLFNGAWQSATPWDHKNASMHSWTWFRTRFPAPSGRKTAHFSTARSKPSSTPEVIIPHQYLTMSRCQHTPTVMRDASGSGATCRLMIRQRILFWARISRRWTGGLTDRARRVNFLVIRASNALSLVHQQISSKSTLWLMTRQFWTVFHFIWIRLGIILFELKISKMYVKIWIFFN